MTAHTTRCDPRTRVLIVGYRQGISDALNRLGVPHAVWTDKPLKTRRSFPASLIHRFPRSRDTIADTVEHFRHAGPFSHVIAGTEAGVFAAYSAPASPTTPPCCAATTRFR